jgi:Spy/CpxP family protein refolding chaperone
MGMNKIGFVKRVVVGGGFLFAAALSFGQLNPPSAAPPLALRPTSAPRSNSAPPPDLLVGVTLTDVQKTKIEEIREQTKSQLAAVASDKTLSPETMDAMMRGYQRIENGKIFDVLTPEQQVEVRKRMAAWKAAARKKSSEATRSTEKDSQSK